MPFLALSYSTHSSFHSTEYQTYHTMRAKQTFAKLNGVLSENRVLTMKILKQMAFSSKNINLSHFSKEHLERDMGVISIKCHTIPFSIPY